MRNARTDRGAGRGVTIVRIVVGLVWMAGAVFNAAVTWRLADPYGWLAEGSRARLYRWFFADVAGAHPSLWTGFLIVGETALGVLTLARGSLARLGLIGGALFSAFLCSLATPYTLIMGPYALLLAWLARRGDHPSVGDLVSSALSRSGEAGHGPTSA